MMMKTVKPRSALVMPGIAVPARVERAVLKKGADARLTRICIANVVIDAASLNYSRANYSTQRN